MSCVIVVRSVVALVALVALVAAQFAAQCFVFGVELSLEMRAVDVFMSCPKVMRN